MRRVSTSLDEVDLTTDATVARLSLQSLPHSPTSNCSATNTKPAQIIANEQLRIAGAFVSASLMRCLAASIEHAKNRVTFGRRLAERQAIQWMLADLSIELRTCTWLDLGSRLARRSRSSLILTRRRWRKNAPPGWHFKPPIRRFKFMAATACVKSFPSKGFIAKRA